MGTMDTQPEADTGSAHLLVWPTGPPTVAPRVSARTADRGQTAKATPPPCLSACQLGAVFDAMAECVILFDPDGRILAMNPAAPRLLGVDARPDFAALPHAERV
jgi:PAS domain-containing protein